MTQGHTANEDSSLRDAGSKPWSVWLQSPVFSLRCYINPKHRSFKFWEQHLLLPYSPPWRLHQPSSGHSRSWLPELRVAGGGGRRESSVQNGASGVGLSGLPESESTILKWQLIPKCMEAILHFEAETPILWPLDVKS